MKAVTVQEKMQLVVKSLPADYTYKMGYINTLVVGDIKMHNDCRDTYIGRGAKYNSSIKYGGSTTVMTLKQLNANYKILAKEENEKAKQKKAFEIKVKKHALLCKKPDYIAKCAAEAVIVIGKPRIENMPGILDRSHYEFDLKHFQTKGVPNKEIEQLTYEEWCADKMKFYGEPDDGYRGCGVYRVGFRNGKRTCTLYGGFHNSKPYTTIDDNAWLDAVLAEMKKHSDHIVKMDGSCTEFYFRDQEDADMCVMASTAWLVPSYRGGMHLNITQVDCEIASPKLLTNA